MSVFRLGSLLVIMMVLVSTARAQKTFVGVEYRGEAPTELVQKFDKFELYRFDFKELNRYVHRDKFDYNIRIKAGGHDWAMSLFPNDIRANGAKMRVMTQDGIVERDKLPNSNYIGNIKGTAQKVAFSITDGFFIGSIHSKEGELFIEAVKNLIDGVPDDMYIVYNTKEVKPVPGITCGAEAGKHLKKDILKKARKVEQRAACYEMEVAYAADWDYNQAHGGVNGAVGYMSSIVNLMAANWDDEFDDEIQVLDGPSFVSDCASCDPWSNTTSAGALLAEFANWGQGGGFNGPYATATLWVTRDISGSVVGIAYLSSMCHGYNVCEDFTSATNTLRQLQCHEIGHNYGCEHTSNGIMAPVVNGSSFWHPASVATVNNNTPWSCMGACLNGSSPIADFGAFPSIGCAPLDVDFLDYSENATSWNWEFEAGIPASSTDQNPTVRYLNKGIYGVTLTVTNNYGTDVKEIPSLIVVRDIPEVSFAMENAFGSNEVHFFDQTDDPEYWEWDFDDGEFSDEQNPVHVYEEDGLYEVTLTVTNACGTATYTDYIEIITPVKAAFSADTTHECGSFCSNFSVVKNNNVDEYLWSFPGGTPSTSTDRTPRVCYSKPGSYKVFLKVKNQRYQDTLTINNYIRVDSNSVAEYRDTVDVVDSLRLYFHDQSLYADSVTWDFGDTLYVDDTLVIRKLDNTDSVIAVLDSFAQVTLSAEYRLDSVDVHFLKDSIYDVQLITHGFCSDDTITQSVVAGKVPVAGIQTPMTSCLGEELIILDGSTPNTTRWKWSITQGQSIESFTTRDVAWTPMETGTYSVQLIAENGVGNDTTNLEILVIDQPTADFSFSAQGVEVTYASMATNAINHFWDFGDGVTSTEESPTHNYTKAGVYQVQYVTQNDCGADTIMKTVDLTTLKAISAVDILEGCSPLSVHLLSQSTGATSVEWILEGSNTPTSTDAELDVMYMQSGVYEIILVAHKGALTDTSRGVFITVDDKPEPGFNFAVSDLDVTFTNTSKGSRLEYEWDFGDGMKSADKDPIHSYVSPGKYTASLKASNLCGAYTWVNEVKISGTNSRDISRDQAIINLSPNPAHHSFEMTLQSLKGQKGQLRIYDLSNKEIVNKKLFIDSDKLVIKVPCQNWPTGLYLVTFSVNEQTFVEKLVVR